LIADGNDVLAVYDATKEAVEECRAGRGPVLVEVKTMRMKGHAQHDPAEYVPKAMLDFWRARDPIRRFEKYLTENKLWDAKKKSEIDARIERELDEDQKFAEESPLPPPELAEQAVYCNGCHTIEADWRRPKNELLPPASSARAVWEVAEFGALDERAAHARQASVPAPVGTKAPQPEAKPVAKLPAKQTRKSPSQAPAQSDVSNEPALRVPFGRGPARGKPFEPRPHDKRGRR
jgi:hypothetical protein